MTAPFFPRTVQLTPGGKIRDFLFVGGDLVLKKPLVLHCFISCRAEKRAPRCKPRFISARGMGRTPHSRAFKANCFSIETLSPIREVFIKKFAFGC